MIRKLRAKLIAVSMFSLLLVLLVVMSGVNLLSYQKVVSDADGTLTVLAENGGQFPKGDGGPAPDHPASPPSGGWKGKGHSPELPYESRFFSVLLGQDGSAAADLRKIAAVDEETAVAWARQVAEEGAARGFLEDYRYAVRETPEGTLVVFLDCGRSLSSFRSNLLASVGVSLLGLLAVLVLIVLLSKYAVRPVAESYEKQKRFITDAGHELKTPLTIIDADAEILEMDLGENEWVRDIQGQVKRLTGLTRDLIYLSRMDEEQSRPQPVEFPLSDLVRETAQPFQTLAKTQGKSLDLRVQPGLSLQGDEKALGHLVTILLDNALKYSPAGSGISLSLERQGKYARLTVANPTHSPLPGDLNQLFERFYRADPSRNSQTGGHGLGLSIAQAIVSAHKGRLTAASPDGASLVMTALLPL